MLDCDVDGTTVQHTLNDVLYVPSAPNSLLSLSRFDTHGRRVVFSGGLCSLYASDGTLLGQAEKVGRLYRVIGRAHVREIATALAARPGAHSWDEWH
ncbi:hypothetical protein AURDEDRAFT_77463, partial [Auricularia subglabra TFB-10046 SS5]